MTAPQRLGALLDRLARLRVPALPVLAAAAAGLPTAWALSRLPTGRPSLTGAVYGRLEASGVGNPVTAVLLNFRSYDTLLEVAVLLAAAIAVADLGAAPRPRAPSLDGGVLGPLTAVLIPLMAVTGAYLLWRGADAPGGAFQAGAVWGAMGVLWQLVRGVPVLPTRRLHGVLVLGPAVFLAVGLAVAADGWLLAYPRAWAGALILLIETAAAVSIGATLALLFAGGLPSGDR